MNKQRLDVIILGVAFFLCMTASFFPFLPDWGVDFLGGKEKVKSIKLNIISIVGVLIIFSVVAKYKVDVARLRVSEVLIGSQIGVNKKLTRGIAIMLRQQMEALRKAVLETLISAFLFIVGAVGFILFALLFLVIFNEGVENLTKTALGILGEESKKDTIEFIGWGIAGILGFFGAVAINRRANAQVKGYVQERFKAAVEHLGNKRETARVASFYEFYHLARDNKDLRESIFDILCAHLRQVTTGDKYKPKIKFNTNKENSEDVNPTEEVRSLLDVLFQRKDSQGKFIFVKFQSDLRGVFLMGSDLCDANLQKVNLQKANLQKAVLWDADLRDAGLQSAQLQAACLLGVDLRYANLGNANLQDVDLRYANLYGAYLPFAQLQSADLRDADLRSVKNLEKANLSGAKIKGAKFPDGYEPPADVDND